MKTTKLIALVLILGITTLGYAQSELQTDKPEPTQNSFAIYLDKAMKNPALVAAMHSQLNPRFLQEEQPRYTVPVRFNHTIVYVTGTYDAWKKFFRILPNEDPEGKLGYQITLKKALTIPQLVSAMRAQLSTEMLHGDRANYIVPVRYRHSVIYVSGGYADWKVFFAVKPKSGPIK